MFGVCEAVNDAGRLGYVSYLRFLSKGVQGGTSGSRHLGIKGHGAH